MVSCKLSGAFSKAFPKFNCEELTVSVWEKVAESNKIFNKKISENFKDRMDFILLFI
jgi:hypothetical protein